MKNIFLLLLLFTGIVHGQIVNIPDANFKNALINTNCVAFDDSSNGDVDADSNNDGEIDITEAATVTHLLVDNSNIADLTGIEAFTNIERLVCHENELTSINISNLSSLKALEISNNPITSINTSGLAQLWYLGCTSTLVTALDFTTNPSFAGLDANFCTELLSLNASGIPGFSMNLFGTTNIQHLNLHGCTAVDGQALQSYMQYMGDLLTLDLAGIQGITMLSFGGNYLDITGCTSIQQLFISGSTVNSIDISSFTNVTDLQLMNGNLTTLDLTDLTNLLYLDCSNNQLTSLNLSSQSNLRQLFCGDNQLTSLDVSGMLQLEQLFCSRNQLSNVDVTALSQLQALGCQSNPITSLNVSNNPQLSYLYCPNTAITSLDVSLNSNLIEIECGSPQLTNLNLKNGKNETLNLTSSPNLLFICADDNQENAIQTIADNNAGLGCVVNSYCSFVPGGNYNKIVGNFIYDADNNGCDSNDSIFPFNIRLNVIGDTTNGGTFTDASGAYAFYTEIGNYSLVPQLEHAEYFNVSPQNPTLNFPLLDNALQTQNFCITPSGLHPDIEVILTPIEAARPGFDATYKIVYKNKGTIPINATINLTFDYARTDFVSAVPMVDFQNADVLTWNFTDLNPFETRAIDFTLNLNTPSENPSLNGGNILNFVASSSIIVDEGTTYDNTFELNQTVVNSYDPNDKTCLEGNTITPENVGKYVHYNINFENIGTADAVNIVVKDIIDTTKFDINSLQLLYASHTVETKIIGNKVEFIFKNINLPSSIQNPIGGHGNVLFKIKTLPTLVVGDQVSNTANIFFDYNAPIQTNEARTTIATLTKNDFIKDETITIAPNPTKNRITVSAKNKLKSVMLFDVQGRLLQTVLEYNKTTTLDISNQANGVYFLKVITEVGSSVEKIVKE